jgi:hypothetical protein
MTPQAGPRPARMAHQARALAAPRHPSGADPAF